ncbi:SDR family oxidoreductase [Nakamurella flavida]|uniref:SDR family oxidoreductase n=1 Tax=Nakamurella flavida TaxID=363630 RepID=A0A939C6L8_9ACTN|nr:SDR family oxidoreductase [Nakamurella flavida]MBM9477317.1 SDR family oxidoreductase [Nakamurella flavida]MDP9779773.1 NADP-dependent 3-hydroxy acid dehydrogenase YdfG [Nakamurella flavida]
MTAGPLAGLTVVVAGATGLAGPAVARALLDQGATVVALGHDSDRLEALSASMPGLQTDTVDLADSTSVRQLAGRLRERHGRIDGLIHLVGGWRGGKSFTGNTDADWAFLSTALVDTLRATTLAFHDDLRASPVGRAVTVSATAVDRPTGGNATYAAAKAAADSWMRSLAHSLGRVATEAEGDLRPAAAATVLVVTALTDRSRPTQPPAPASFTDVTALADRIVGLFTTPAADVNGARLPA